MSAIADSGYGDRAQASKAQHYRAWLTNNCLVVHGGIWKKLYDFTSFALY